jgi:hypothetical protein
MLKRTLLVTTLALGLTVNSLGHTRRLNAAPGSVGARALAYFKQIEDGSFDDHLRRIRPRPLSPRLKAQVIARLPQEGEVKPSAKMQVKLAALAPVFHYHERGGAIEVKVISVGHAFVGLHARSGLLISEEALDLLTTEELRAAAAHEMGHEYFWNEYQLARADKQYQVMRELELRCDGVAVITLKGLGLDPSRLISQVTKMTRFNERIGATANLYTSLDERVEFIRALVEVVKAKGVAAPMIAHQR